MLEILGTLTDDERRPRIPPPRQLKPRTRLAFGVAAVAAAVVLAAGSSAAYVRARDGLDRRLLQETGQQAVAFAANAQRTRATTLLTAQDPVFQEFYRPDGDRLRTIADGGPTMDRVHTVLNFLEVAYPDRIGEVCFIDRTGAENARVVRGAAAGFQSLSPDETGSVFFAETVALRPGEVFRSRPYESPDTGEWVVSQSTPIADSTGTTRGMFHVELTIEGLRAELASRPDHRHTYIVDGRTGAVIVDSEQPQEPGAPLGQPGESWLVPVTAGGTISGLLTIGDRRVAFERLESGVHRDGDWYIVVAGEAVGLWSGRAPIVKVATVGFLVLMVGLLAWATRWFVQRRALARRRQVVGRLA